MDKLQESLYQRICGFQFDEPGCQRTFARRLAAENGWSVAFAARAVNEYRRFVFLAMTAGHAVCPSDEVDEVWHLHLIYTRSYRKFCDEVLGQRFDHDPSQGGSAELAKHRRMYAQTLAYYEETFGEEPPADLWPAVDERFCQEHRRKIDPSSYWMLPKPSLRRMAAKFAGWTEAPPAHTPTDVTRHTTYCFAAGGLAFAASYALLPLAAIGPFDMKGPEFLALYAVLVAAGFVIGAGLRYWARRRDPIPMADTPELDPYETAYLAGGERRAINTAVATLTRSGHLDLASDKPPSFTKGTPPAADCHPVERATHAAFGGHIYTSLQTAQRKARKSLRPIQERLRELGLLTSSQSNFFGLIGPLLLMGGIVAMGLIKINIGIERGKPVTILIIIVALTAIASAIAFARPIERTPLGDRHLESLRKRLADLPATIQNDPEGTPSPQLATAVGLFGFGLLSAYSIGSLHTVLAGLHGGATAAVTDAGEGVEADVEVVAAEAAAAAAADAAD